MSDPKAKSGDNFVDARSHYLFFAAATDEKAQIVNRVAKELDGFDPQKSGGALRLFDAGCGNGKVLDGVLEHATDRFGKTPIQVTAKEFSADDLLLAVDRLPPFFQNHQGGFRFVATNLPFKAAASLKLSEIKPDSGIQVIRLQLQGSGAANFRNQIEAAKPQIGALWQAQEGDKGLKPAHKAVLVIERAGNSGFPNETRANVPGHHDLVICSQPWRAGQDNEAKAKNIVAPLMDALRPDGKLVGFHSIPQAGDGTAHSMVSGFFRHQSPLANNKAADIFSAAQRQIGAEASQFKLGVDAKPLTYALHPWLNDGPTLGVSRTHAAVYAGLYVEQVPPEKSRQPEQYFDQAAQYLERSKGRLAFHDEVFVIHRTCG